MGYVERCLQPDIVICKRLGGTLFLGGRQSAPSASSSSISLTGEEVLVTTGVGGGGTSTSKVSTSTYVEGYEC